MDFTQNKQGLISIITISYDFFRKPYLAGFSGGGIFVIILTLDMCLRLAFFISTS